MAAGLRDNAVKFVWNQITRPVVRGKLIPWAW
jgi:hypothetical protein